MTGRLLFLAAAVFCAFGLSACGSEPDTSGPSAPQTGQTTASTGPGETARRRPEAAPRFTPAELTAAQDRFAAKGRPVYCGARKKPWVALTFDDGPGPYTKHVLALLRRFDVPATFFLVGRNVAPNRSSVLREKSARRPIGNHSWSHPLLPSLSGGEQKSQILNTSRAVSRVTGDPVRLFRPPYGARDAATDRIVRRADMTTILWNIDSRDALGANSKQISRSVKKGFKPGSIILLHENRGQTVRALRYTVLPALKKSGMTAVTVPQMLAGNPPSDAQLSKGRKGCR